MGWRVGDVLNHLVAEHLWAPHLLRGESLEDVGDRYAGDVLGTSPRTAWRRAIAGSLTAWASPDPDATVATSAGPTPVEEYAEQMLVDLTGNGTRFVAAEGGRLLRDDLRSRLGQCVRVLLQPRHEPGRGDEADDPDGHVDEEDPLPAGRVEEQAAEQRADEEGDAGGRAPQPHGRAAARGCG